MRNSWRSTMILFAVTGVIESLAFGHLGAFTPLFLAQLNVPAASISSWTGVLGALGFVLGLPLLPFWGVWADRYSRKLIIIRSAYIEAVLFAIAAMSVNVWMLALARFLSGFVLGNTGVMLAAQAETTPRQRIGTAIALISAGPVLGQALGPVLGGQIVEYVGIRALLGFDALLTGLIGVVLTVVLRENPRPPSDATSVWASILAAGRNIFEQPLVVRLFALDFAIVLGVTMAGPFVPLRIEALYQGDRLASMIGWVLTLSGLGMALSTPLWGRMSDRWGFSRVLRLAVIGVGVALAGQALSVTLASFGGWRVAQGLVQGGTSATITALIATHIAAERRTSVLNFSRLPAQLAWFVGPLLGAAVARVSLPGVFGVAAGLLALATVLVLVLRIPASTGTGMPLSEEHRA